MKYSHHLTGCIYVAALRLVILFGGALGYAMVSIRAPEFDVSTLLLLSPITSTAMMVANKGQAYK